MGLFSRLRVSISGWQIDVLEMADRHGIGFFELKEYLERWENKGLVTFRPFILTKRQP